MKTAIVYDRVNKWGGAERVLLTLHEMFPDAPLYTSVYNPKTAEWAKVFPRVYTSFLQKIPFAKNNHESFAALMPFAFESFNFDEYDLVISVTSEAAKGIITKPNTKHICYMLTPTRYLWSGYDDYFKGLPFKVVASPMVKYLRKWDKIAAARPDKIVAISTEVKNRIEKYYGRKSEVVFPPISISNYKPLASRFKKFSDLTIENELSGGYFLVVSRLVAYKRVDLAIKAFNISGKKLVIVGSGREENKLKRMAKKNIIFMNHLTEAELTNYYSNTKALILPQNEDFGLVAVEAQACGTPVVAFRGGGALDTVVDGVTGVFFDSQSEHSLIAGLRRFDTIHFDKEKIRANADRFKVDNFKNMFEKLITK